MAKGSVDAPSDIGFRTEDPGPFLDWPLQHVNISDVVRLPDSPWSHNFLGVTDCPPYPAAIGSSKKYIKEGITESQVLWVNSDNTGWMADKVACYSAGEKPGQYDHAGTDIQAANGTSVLAAADADEIYVIIDGNGDYRIRLRHPNVNGSGQTWYTFYLHMKSSKYSEGTHTENFSVGTELGGVGRGHLHLAIHVNPTYNANYARNPWGLDSTPWNQGCLWNNRDLCQNIGDKPADEDIVEDFGRYSDVAIASQWYPYIEALHRVGAIQGTGSGASGQFKPTEMTDRDQAAKMISLGLGRKPNYTDGQAAFSDVPTSHPFYQYIRDIKVLGITQGYRGGLYYFDPDKPGDKRLTRCHAAVFVIRARNEGDHFYNDGRQSYPDVPPSHSCYQFIERLLAIGASPYETGNGLLFNPDGYIERERMAFAVVRGLPQLLKKVAPFKDVAHDNLFFAHVESIAERAITSGCNNSQSHPYRDFCPDVTLLREQAAAFLSRAMGFAPNYSDGRQSFPDVNQNHPFYHAIEHVRELGVVKGFNDGNFRPATEITREQFAQMIVRGWSAIGVVCPNPQGDSFPDVSPGANAYVEIQCLKDFGVTAGYSDGKFWPGRLITRAQAAKFVDLAFIQKLPTVEQEPMDKLNDIFATAPIVRLASAPTSSPEVEDEDASPGVSLILPNASASPQGGNLDIVGIDLESAKKYRFAVQEMGRNLDAGVALVTSQVAESRSATELIQTYSIAANILNLGIDGQCESAFSVPETGRYYLVFFNENPYAVGGVNFRFAVSELESSLHKIYLPSIVKVTDSTVPPSISGCSISFVEALDIPAVPPPNDYVAYYTFDSKNAADQSANGNHGTIKGNPGFVSGTRGEAIRFYGSTSENVLIPNSASLQLHNTFTLSIWFMIASHASQDGLQVPFAMSGDTNGAVFELRRENASSGLWRPGIENGRCCGSSFVVIQAGTLLDLNQWHMLTVTHSPDRARLYLDGVLAQEMSATTFNLNPGMLYQPIYLATHYDANRFWHPFNGALDEVRIYNREISTAEVLALFDESKQPALKNAEQP